MTFNKFKYMAMSLAGLLCLSSCVDDKYDLSDIDSTTAFKLSQVIVPVRLQTITLDQVLDLKDDDLIKEYIDDTGKKYYGIEKEGEFNADPVLIDYLKLTDPVYPVISFPGMSGEIKDKTVSYSYLIKNVDPALINLSYFGLKANEQMKVDLTVTPSDISLSQVVIKLPSTYTVSYKGNTYTEGQVPVTISNGHLDEPIYVTTMTFDPVLPSVNNQLNITGEIGFQSAKVENASGDFTVQFSMSPFTVETVSGKINKKVDSPKINPVVLNGLPDYLKGEETNIILSNPQLYLDFSTMYGALYNIDMDIVPQGNKGETLSLKLNPFPGSIVVAPDVQNLNLPGLLVDPVYQPDNSLRTLLAGSGIPTSLNFNITNTYLDGEIKDLVLGTDQQISGSYTFFTPLEFEDGTDIIYNNKETNFFGDDMKYVEVNEFLLTSDITTDLPFDVDLTLYPLDKNANHIFDAQGREVKASAHVATFAKNAPLNLYFTQTFFGLDGIEYVVTTDKMNNSLLAPDQTIVITNIRAKITGKLVKDF